MRAAWVPVAALLAGCLSTSGPAPGTGEMDYVLDCGIRNWAEACNVRASPNESPSKTEVNLAVHPVEPGTVFVASKDLDPLASPCVWSVGQRSADAGRTWTTVYVGGTYQDRADPQHPLYGWDCITDPMMAFDTSGVLYYALQAYALRPQTPPPVEGVFTGGFAGSAYYLAVSRDGGATFPPEDILALAAGDGVAVFHDFPRMVANPATGTVTTVWNAVAPGGTQGYAVSTRDQGRTAEPPVLVNLPGAPLNTLFWCGLAAGADGTLYLTLIDLPPGHVARAVAGMATIPPARFTTHLAVSADDGASFGSFAPMFEVASISDDQRQLPNSEFRAVSCVELAVDRSGGSFHDRLYAVWADGGAGNADLRVTWSDDRGTTWSAPVTVAGNLQDEFMPRPVVDAHGVLHVVYLDRSHDPANRLLDATHAWSADGGGTWRSQRLTTQSFDGDLGVHQDRVPFIGDYLGIDARGGEVWFGFPTTFTGVAEVAVGRAVRTGGAEP